MVKVFGMSVSGNCHKVRMLLEHLRLPYEWIEIDALRGETRTPEFLTLNPNGRVPALQVESGRILAESNAILCYLADGTGFWPNERWARAQILQWLFFEQYSHEPYVAVARFIRVFLPADHARRAELPRLHERGDQALEVMEKHLGGNDFFVSGQYSIADIALFAYTAVADTGGFNLGRYPAIRAWLERVRMRPNFVAMP